MRMAASIASRMLSRCCSTHSVGRMTLPILFAGSASQSRRTVSGWGDELNFVVIKRINVRIAVECYYHAEFKINH